MAGEDRTKFDIQEKPAGGFNQLIKTPKKKVAIDGENNFGNDAFSSMKPTPTTTTKTGGKRGRPKVITDERFIVCKPKKISPALETKLKALEDYMGEFRETTGRVTFEMMVTALADSYIDQRLSVGKSEKVKEDIKMEMDKLNENK